jgi:hypothetical protein
MKRFTIIFAFLTILSLSISSTIVLADEPDPKTGRHTYNMPETPRSNPPPFSMSPPPPPPPQPSQPHHYPAPSFGNLPPRK